MSLKFRNYLDVANREFLDFITRDSLFKSYKIGQYTELYAFKDNIFYHIIFERSPVNIIHLKDFKICS